MSTQQKTADTYGVTEEACFNIEAAADRPTATTRKTLAFKASPFKVGDYKVSISVEREPVSTDEEAFVAGERSRINENNARKAREAADAKQRELETAGSLAIMGALKAESLMAALRRG